MGDVLFSGTAKIKSGVIKPKESVKVTNIVNVMDQIPETQESKDTPCTHSKCKPPSEQ